MIVPMSSILLPAPKQDRQQAAHLGHSRLRKQFLKADAVGFAAANISGRARLSALAQNAPCSASNSVKRPLSGFQ
jgi:hypothetical protein